MQVSAELRRYITSQFLGCVRHDRRIRISTGETLLYSGHEADNLHHTERVGLMIFQFCLFRNISGRVMLIDDEIVNVVLFSGSYSLIIRL